ncbi:hypothetical protein BDZ91DRAFT_711683 [Kalaharituber pfeilii]|nr:hypothetical protein BDZ91DRAFT_711683 [Kalaharituber pfeilii]
MNRMLQSHRTLFAGHVGLYELFSHSVTRVLRVHRDRSSVGGRKEFRDYGKETKEEIKEYVKESADANTRYILSEMRSEIRSLEIRLSSKTE